MKKERKQPTKFHRAPRQRMEDGTALSVSSYGCVDADFDDNDTYVAGLREELRGRF